MGSFDIFDRYEAEFTLRMADGRCFIAPDAADITILKRVGGACEINGSPRFQMDISREEYESARRRVRDLVCESIIRQAESKRMVDSWKSF